MPMTYLAGIHGFAYFVPYLLFVGVLAMVIAQSRRVRRRSVPAVAYVPVLEFEAAPA